MISDKLLNEIDRGRQGLNHGISMKLPKLESIIDGVTRETYTLILSNSGAGKTSFALYAYVYRPLMEHLDDDDFKVLYFSLEMGEVALYIKLLSIYIFETYGIQLSSKKLEIYDKKVTPKKVYAILKTRLEEMGTFSESETRLVYTPNNPNLIYNVVVDHIGLVGTKPDIDLLSSYLLFLRDKCFISPVVIQQANREQGNIERFKQGKSAFTIHDAKDSGNTVQDCNIMIALYNPHRDGLKTYKHYNIEYLGSYYRSIMVLKNRYGDCDVEVGVNFFGWINMFYELPKPDEIYDYERYTSPNYILEDNSSIVEQELDDITELDNSNSNFNFALE